MLAAVLAPLAGDVMRIERFLDSSLFGTWTLLQGTSSRRVTTVEGRLLWFARAFRSIGREFGFTPARTLATKACLMAWEAGVTLEVAEVLACVYDAARTGWNRYLRFSGGSRFDSEFLIRVDEGMLAALEQDDPNLKTTER
jgi:hypothetical protein